MDRDGFVEFVRTFVERKTKGSKVVTRSQSVEITECDCANRARGLYKLASYLALHLRPVVYPWTGPASEPGNQLSAQRNPWIVRKFVLCALRYAQSMDCA